MAIVTKEDVKTKEDLIEYLDTVGELPFLEELWEECLIKAEENKDKEVPMKEVKVKDKHGNVTIKNKVAGVVIKDPVKWYFRMMGMTNWKKKAILLAEQRKIDSESRQEIMEAFFGEDDTQEYDDIAAWINMFINPEERQYLKQRLSHYYDNYDINDGADRVMLSGILSIEIELYRINMKRAQGKAIDIVKEEKLRKMLRENLESQKWTKKQRSATDEMAQNKFTIWMERQAKQGKFIPDHHEIPKDEIDMLIEIIPEAIRKMFD
jgi:hypothetical protein